jgi:hypothetical protein
MINELDTVEPRVVNQDEIDAQVISVISSLGQTYRDFGLASKTYNLAFFKGEPKEFSQALALALINHYPMWPNLFWNNLSQSE